MTKLAARSSLSSQTDKSIAGVSCMVKAPQGLLGAVQPGTHQQDPAPLLHPMQQLQRGLTASQR